MRAFARMCALRRSRVRFQFAVMLRLRAIRLGRFADVRSASHDGPTERLLASAFLLSSPNWSSNGAPIGTVARCKILRSSPE